MNNAIFVEKTKYNAIINAIKYINAMFDEYIEKYFGLKISIIFVKTSSADLLLYKNSLKLLTILALYESYSFLITDGLIYH